MIADVGIVRLSTRRIAEVAGVSEATIFKYFPTKNELILTALRHGSVPSGDELHKIDRRVGSVEAGLRLNIVVALRYYDRVMGPVVAAMADISILSHHREWLLKNMSITELSATIKGFVKHEQGIGRIRKGIDPAAVAGLILGAALRQVVGRMFRGVLSTPNADNRFARDLARGLLPMIAVDVSQGRAMPPRGRRTAAKR
jgi:AcrR family transcriptional regulator